MKKTKVLIGLLFVVSLLISACSPSKKANQLVVGSKDFTESIIIGELYTQALQHAGFDVKHQQALGASNILLEALKANNLDIISEYTSTGLNVILKEPAEFDPQLAYEKVKAGYQEQFKLRWLDLTAINNTQCLAITQVKADEIGFTNLSDLAKAAPHIRFAATPEFEEREDGLKGLEALLGEINFKDIRVYDKGIKYQILRNDEADMNVCFSTDADLAKGNLIMINDDLSFWPPYHLAAVVREEVLNDHPKVADVLNEVAAHLTIESIQALNAQVDIDELEYADVAKAALKAWGILP